MIGLDTGFFFQLESKDNQAAEVFERIHAGQEIGAVSSVTIYELLKHGLKGSLPQHIVDLVVENAPEAFVTAEINELDVLRRAARVAHGMGLSMADAMIAASLENVGCDKLYTSDSDFAGYNGPMQVIFL